MRSPSSPLQRADWLMVAGLVVAKLAVHAVNDPAYGYFRDELYYLACARQLDWGYVDMPPLAAVYARAAIALGGSLFVLRAIAAAAGAGALVLTMAMARELGGRRFAMGLAGLAVLAAPVYLGIDSFLSMNAFEPVFWMGCAYALMCRVRSGDRRWWLVFGLLAGLGLENKHSMLLFGLSAAVALLLSAQRRDLLSPWLWAGGAIAVLLVLPNLVWQFQHGFPTLEDLRNVQATGKNVVLGPIAYLGRQVLMMHPVLLPVWLAGLWHYLAGQGARLRILGWLYLALLVTMIVLQGKDYYLAPVYPMLLAAGAVAVEGWLSRMVSVRARQAVQVAIPLLIAVAAVPIAITVLPVLPPAQWGTVAARLGIPIVRNETGERSQLPQLLADRTGWEELVIQVADVYRALPVEERARTGIFAGNYGGAGAVDWFGPAHGLPAVMSGHQTYFYWGARGFAGETMIVLESPRNRLEPACATLTEAARHDNPYGMGWENGPIWLCRGLKVSLPEVWPTLKFWS